MPGDKTVIMHFSDTHIAAGKAYLEDFSAAIPELLACAARADAVIFTGDLFHERLHVDNEAVSLAVDMIKEICERAPMYLLQGTKLHDFDSLEIFRSIKTRHPLFVISTPGVFYPSIGGVDMALYCLPGIRKQHYEAFAQARDMSKTKISELVSMELESWRVLPRHLRARDAIFAGHIQTEGYEKMESGYEPVISTEEIKKAINPSLGLLGHIHEAGEIGKGFFYSGSLIAGNMSDAGVVEIKNRKLYIKKKPPVKGFYLHEKNFRQPQASAAWKSSFIEVSGPSYLKVFMEIKNKEDLEKGFELLERYLSPGNTDLKTGKIKPCRTYVQIQAELAGVEAREFIEQESVLRKKIDETYNGKIILRPPRIISQVLTRGKESLRVGDRNSWEKKTLKDKFFDWGKENGKAFEADELAAFEEKLNLITGLHP